MKYHIGMLVEKSLIKINWDGKVTLHDLIEDMGKEIVRKKSPEEPGKHSRLWFPKDIVQVLEENKGTSQIEIIFMDFTLFEEEEVQVEWDGDAFKKMKNLKTLIIRNCLFSRGPKHLPNALRVLEWWRYPSQDLPYDFHPKKLVLCKLPKSRLASLELAALSLKKKLMNLTCLNFDMCQYLTQIPDVSCLSHLEKLSFRNCKNLFTIHYSVGLLEKLKILNAIGCVKLKSFPPIKLTSLEQFNLSYCESLESFPEILGKMENITQLWLEGTPIKEFPLSFRNLTRLKSLHLTGCLGLGRSCLDAAIFIRIISMMPELAEINAFDWKGWVLLQEDEDAEKMSLTVCSNVQRLALKKCMLFDEFFPIFLPYFANVKELDLSFNNFIVIPECIKECHFLTRLELNECEHLREIRKIPPKLKYFSAKRCTSLTSSCRSMLLNQELHEAGNTVFYLPGAKIPIPKWFECQTWGRSISIWFRNKFPAIAICLVVEPGCQDCRLRSEVIINGNQLLLYWGMEMMETDSTRLFDLREIRLEDNLGEALFENEWNHAKIKCVGSEFISIKWGIHVLKQQSSMEDIQLTDPCRKRKLDDDIK